MYKKIIAGILSACMLCPISVSAKENNVLYGDANCDGIVDVCDVTAVKKHIIKLDELSEQGLINADTNKNGDVGIDDLGSLVKYTIKVIDSLEHLSSDSENEFYMLSSYYKSDSMPFNNKFITSYDDLQNMYISDTIKSQMLKDYNESFFENNVLYAASVSEGTSSGKYNLNHVETSETEINIYIDLVTNGSHTDDMCKKIVCVGIPKKVYNGQKVNIDTKIISLIDKETNFENACLTFFVGEYPENEFKNLNDINVINPYVCQGKNISSVSELKEILNNEDSELLNIYSDDFFNDSNQLIVIQYAEGYTDVTYSECPQAYNDLLSGKRNIYIKRQLSENSIFNPHIKYLVYSTWFGSAEDTANVIFK